MTAKAQITLKSSLKFFLTRSNYLILGSHKSTWDSGAASPPCSKNS